MIGMKITVICLCITLGYATAATAAKEDTRKAKQAELDEICEAARQAKIVPARNQFIEECVTQPEKDRAYCERFYADYGSRSGNRAPLYFDLPECVAAFAYSKGDRAKD